MRRLTVTVLDLVARGPTRKYFSRIMNPNYASVMPQAVAVWCEQLGHRVLFLCYSGSEDLSREIPGETDRLIVGAFSRSAQAAYAVSNLFQRRGTVTALGGPHARCFPQDAARYFDYVLGSTDRAVVAEMLRDCQPHRPLGVQLGAKGQPPELPGVRERWKFIEPTLAKARHLQMVPMLASMGCPYKCSFCIDSQVDYQPLATDQIGEDLRFLLKKLPRPLVAWHDPLFGVRFDEMLTTIERVVPPDRIDFAAEISLSLLSETHVQRLARNGFKALLPGIESWYEMGNKAKTGRRIGQEKVEQVAEHIDMLLRYMPYVQTNFVLGLDCDEGAEPFELTKQFLERVPGAFPAFSFLTAYGQAAPLNLRLQREGRVIPMPFHFLDSHWMNVRPKHYSWPGFYRLAGDLARSAQSWPSIARRFRANRGFVPRGLNLVRALSSNRVGRLARVVQKLEKDAEFRRFFEGESTEVPAVLEGMIRRDLGPLWEALPRDALSYDANAYARATAVDARGMLASA